MTDASLRRPQWHLPAGVHAFVTTRLGGYSSGAYAGFNLGKHVDDDPVAVQKNRGRLQQLLQEEAACERVQIQWLQQVHGTSVLQLEAAVIDPAPRADAIHTTLPAVAACIMTADCLPVLFCSENGREIAVAHAGWRGLLGGVLENTVNSFQAKPAAILAWLGPAIGPCHFEVGDEVRAAFLSAAAMATREAVAACFHASDLPGKWLADLYALARLRLLGAGLLTISGEANCTVCHSDIWYSHRHSQPTGRFGTLILKS